MSVTSTVAGSPVQKGAFEALAADSTFYTTLLGGRFYTNVPQGTAFPLAWLAFEEPMESPAGTFGKVGRVVHLALHVYSDYAGDDQALDIMQRASETLDAGITVSGWTVPWVNGERTHTLTVDDYNGRALRHGVLRVDVHAFKS